MADKYKFLILFVTAFFLSFP